MKNSVKTDRIQRSSRGAINNTEKMSKEDLQTIRDALVNSAEFYQSRMNQKQKRSK